MSGYTGIPTDGSAVLPIPGIGPHYEGMALICQHGITGIPPSAAIDKWFLVHENGDEEEVGISGNTGFTLSRGQNDGVVRLERNSGSSSLEGVYKCVVEANPTESVTVYLYWPSKSFCTEPHVINTKNRLLVLTNIALNIPVVILFFICVLSHRAGGDNRSSVTNSPDVYSDMLVRGRQGC